MSRVFTSSDLSSSLSAQLDTGIKIMTSPRYEVPGSLACSVDVRL